MSSIVVQEPIVTNMAPVIRGRIVIIGIIAFMAQPPNKSFFDNIPLFNHVKHF